MNKKFRPVISILVLTLALGPALSLAVESQYASDQAVESIRARIRAEAGISVQEDAQPEQKESCEIPAPGADLPMVAVTALKGDTLEKLALELTGTKDSMRIIAAASPEIRAGEKILLPRTLLRPQLSDPETVRLPVGLVNPSLKAVVTEHLAAGRGGEEMAARNLQRLNSISDVQQLKPGQEVEVPQAMLKRSAHRAGPVEIRDDYRASGSRKAVYAKTKSGKRGKRIVRAAAPLQKRDRDVDLVVIHTTEHSGASFDATAAYIKRNHLANYVIGPKGEIYRIIPEEYRAHGCGEAIWDGVRDVDERAINIEVYANTAPTGRFDPISDLQYEGLGKLLDDIRSRRPEVHSGRIVTHSMVAMSFKYKTRSRKGDPYVFDWAKAGLPNNAEAIDQDVLLGRVKLCQDRRYADRVTVGQEAAAKLIRKM